MKLIAIGYIGSYRVYVNITKEEAIKRYEKENLCNVTTDDIIVRELFVNEEFNVYDIWTD